MFHSDIRLTAIQVSLKDQIVGDNVGGNPGLGNEAVEGKELRVFRLAKLSIEHRVDGEDCRATVGVDRVPGIESSLVEVVLADES